MQFSVHVNTRGRVFDPRAATELLVDVAREWARPIARATRDEWRRGVKRRTGAFQRSIIFRTHRRLERIAEVYSTMPELRQVIDEEGLREGRGRGRTYADSSQNRRLDRVGRPWRAVPGTGAGARAARLAGHLIAREGRALEREYAFEMNR